MQDVNFIEKLGLKPPLLGGLYLCFTLCYHSQYSLGSAMLKTCKYRIYPTQEQSILLAKSFGCVRWFYNFALNLTSIGNKLERSRFCQYPFVHKYNWIIMIIKQGVRVGESACGRLSHASRDYHSIRFTS